MVMRATTRAVLAAITMFVVSMVHAKKDTEIPVDEYYKLDKFTMPEGEEIEVGSLEWMPDGRLAVGSRRGEIWMVHDALGDPAKATWKRYAHGLHQVLGLAYNKKDGYLYVTQRGEITKVKWIALSQLLG